MVLMASSSRITGSASLGPEPVAFQVPGESL